MIAAEASTTHPVLFMIIRRLDRLGPGQCFSVSYCEWTRLEHAMTPTGIFAALGKPDLIDKIYNGLVGSAHWLTWWQDQQTGQYVFHRLREEGERTYEGPDRREHGGLDGTMEALTA